MTNTSNAAVIEVDETRKKMNDMFMSQARLTAYAHAITTFSFPELPGQEKWMTKFIADLGIAQENMTHWTDELGPAMFAEIPQSIISYGNLFSASTAQLRDIFKRMPNSIADANENDRRAVDALFSEIFEEVNEKVARVKELKNELDAFKRKVVADHRNFKQAQNEAKNASRITDAELDDIQRHIKELTLEIENASKVSMVSGIGVGVGLFVGIAALGLTIATGGLAAPIILATAVVGLGYAGYKLVDSQMEQSAKQAELRKRWKALDAKKQQAVALATFGDSLQSLVDCCDDALKGLDAISNFWSTLGSKLGTLKSELTNAAKDKAMIVRDVHLTSGQDAWRQLVDYATLLQRTADDIEVQNSEIAVAA